MTGHLTYDFYEKDKNEGTIAGELNKDTLIADYTFRSEGTTSIREVAFLITDAGLTEGYGELVAAGDKMVFKNRHALSFSNTILKKMTCDN